MTEDEDQPIFERGDVVFGSDPYKGQEAARPWLILVTHEGRPFHGDQYVAVTLTTRTWMDGLVEIDDDHWLRGGTPTGSRIVPWGVQSIAAEDIDHWQGRLADSVVDQAIDELVNVLR